MKFIKTLVLAVLLGLSGCATTERHEARWFSGWATSHNARETAPAMSGRTVRMVLTPNISGNAVRVKLENTMGQSPVTFSGAFIAIASNGPAQLQGSSRRLTFDGKSSLTLAPGQGDSSDPVLFPIKAFDKLALSLEVQSAADISAHHVGLRINWSAPGVRGSDDSGAGFEPLPEAGQAGTGQWPFYWVAALDVHSTDARGSVAFLADSITDGRCSTRDGKGVVQPNLDQRWGDVLARRLAATGTQLGFANAGIAGNRVLNRGNGPSALERVERDALERAGLTHVVFFEGTNDIAGDFSAAQIIAGTRQIIDKVRAKGVKIIGVTVIPRGNATVGPKWTAAYERERLALNAWIRTPGSFDAVIDFDALMKSGPVVRLADGSSAPAIPEAWNCDGVHPNAAGYKAMGEFVDLGLFR